MVLAGHPQYLHKFYGTILSMHPHCRHSDLFQIRHLQARLSLRLRTRLTRYTHDLYLSSDPHLRYYRISGQGGIDGVDQYITADIASWADSLSGL